MLYNILPFSVFSAIWCILRLFGIFCGYLFYFVVIWYIFPRFGMLYQKNLATRVGEVKKIFIEFIHSFGSLAPICSHYLRQLNGHNEA
jgi:positive regulator of sigma E activity